jgi:hypothetical protein
MFEFITGCTFSRVSSDKHARKETLYGRLFLCTAHHTCPSYSIIICRYSMELVMSHISDKTMDALIRARLTANFSELPSERSLREDLFVPSSPAALDAKPAAPACTTAQSRFHAIVEAMEAEFEASWPSLSTVERQHALTALAQAKQFEVLLSAHVVQPGDALDHKHNSLVAGTAQAVLTNSLKVDETSFKRNQGKNYYAEIRAAMEAYRARQAEQLGKP